MFTSHLKPKINRNNGWSWWKCSDEGEGSEIGWKGYGHYILGCNIPLLIDYFKKGKYYRAILDQLIDAIKEKRPHLAKKKSAIF